MTIPGTLICLSYPCTLLIFFVCFWPNYLADLFFILEISSFCFSIFFAFHLRVFFLLCANCTHYYSLTILYCLRVYFSTITLAFANCLRFFFQVSLHFATCVFFIYLITSVINIAFFLDFA